MVDRKIEVSPALIGVGACVALTWVAVLWTIFRKPLSSVPPINIWNVNGGDTSRSLAVPQLMAPPPATAPQQTPAMAAADRSSRSSALATYQLSTSNPSRLATAAGPRFWVAEVRTVGPPGSFAIVSLVANALTQGNVPGYDAIVIPAGGSERIRLAPGQALFGVGNVNNTVVSVNCSEEYPAS